MITISLQNEDLTLLPSKAIFWEKEDTLLLADTHFGKISHFRRWGIAVPEGVARNNLQRFRQLVQEVRVKRVVVLGDLFHSELNMEWIAFKEVIRGFPKVDFHLVMGNHDILHELSYGNANMEVHYEPWRIGPFLLSHEPIGNADHYNLCGHIHPGVQMLSTSRQSLRLPCFYFGDTGGILPAFGQFTGLHLIRPKRKDKVFVIAGEKVLPAN